MIDGKSRREIEALTRYQKQLWYPTLGLVDRGIAMELVKIAGQAKMKAAWTPEKRARQSVALSGENSPNYGKTASDETRTRQREVWTPERRAKKRVVMSGENSPNYGKTYPDERRANMSAAWTPEKRARQSVVRSGKNHPSWQGGASFEPYSPEFNDSKKEEVRNRDERTCQLCGKPEVLNGRRLAAHHIDGDKMNTDSSNLAALCVSCNSKKDTLEKEFLIVANLNLNLQSTS